MKRRTLLGAMLSIGLGAAFVSPLGIGAASAQETVKIGLILPLTGPFASAIGRHVEGAVRTYMQQNGDMVAGKKIEVIVKDDAGAPETTKRLAQELVTNDKVQILAGFGLTPLALSVAPIATQAKIPQVVMAAATSIITERSPYIVRSSFTLPQVTAPLADWAVKNGIKKVATLVADYGPGLDAEKTFNQRFTAAGGEIVANLHSPLRSPEFAPYLQRILDAKPDAVFLFVPSGQGALLLKQVTERDFAKAGIRVIATGDVTDDNDLNEIGDIALGIVTSHHYSAAHDSPENKAFRQAFAKANEGRRPNLMSIGGYDGMALIYKALEKTKGDTDGTKLVEAMKGVSMTSPRGPISIDPETRDIVQNVYMRKVERVNGELYNVEFATIEAVKDPGKTPK
ncbi:MAG: ABC transporter substrate-binding protein [Beijerinckiaceae bacterium]|nr:ABC transporter substrate-binding protein [Beijerinckiaceae bacterium]